MIRNEFVEHKILYKKSLKKFFDKFDTFQEILIQSQFPLKLRKFPTLQTFIFLFDGNYQWYDKNDKK